MSAIAGNGTGMERDYDYTSTLHAVRSGQAPRRSAATPANARWRGSIRARSRPATCRWCSIRAISGSLVGHLASAVNGASIARKTSFLRETARRADFRQRHRHHRRSAAPARAALAAVRRRRRRHAKLAIVDDGVLKTWLLDCATARELGLETTGHAHRGVSSSPSPGPTICISKPAARRPPS